jgi:hypothetical protein
MSLFIWHYFWTNEYRHPSVRHTLNAQVCCLFIFSTLGRAFFDNVKLQYYLRCVVNGVLVRC